MATVIMQARMGSTRLPGKALKEILGRPMLYYAVTTLKQAPAVDRIVLAIPDLPRDNPLTELAEQWGIDWFRGSEPNVLERFYQAAQKFKDTYYFRATGDNPVLDSGNPRRLLEHLTRSGCDYVWERGMPLGSVVEGFTFDALERCYHEAQTEADREHVTLYMKKSRRYRVESIEAAKESYFPKLRLTVDYPEDFQWASRIIEELYREGVPPFQRVIDFARQNGKI